MDTTAGAINAMYRMKYRLPTRFMYDFMLYNNLEAAYTQAFQQEFMAALEASPPPAIVITKHSWPDPEPSFARTALIPGFDAFVSTHYQLVVDNEGYRIYARHAE